MRRGDEPGGPMPDEADFKCLRCGAEFKLHYVKGVIEERTCPKCGSNSVRMIKKKEAK